MRRSLIAVASLAVAAAPAPAWAFKVETSVTPACYEPITFDAAVAAGFPDGSLAPAPTEDQRRAMDDLTFSLPHRDVWTMTLLIGARSNDVRDLSPADVAGLVSVHNDPDAQDDHCLRAADDDGTAGDVTALAACRAFILDELDAAGLLGDALDLGAVEPVATFLAFRRHVSLTLPRFAYHLGRAAHALEDSYTHAFRAPTGEVTAISNWIDFATGGGDAARDGYPHVDALDVCTRDDPRMARRVARATAATTALLAAIADPAPGRRTRVEAVLDGALAYLPGCDASNRYCDAEELDEEADDAGCAIAGGASLLPVLAAALVLGRRRRRAAAAALVAVVALSAAPAPARADTRWHLDGRVGASNDYPAAAVLAGVGADRGRWTMGLGVEWNPWFSLAVGRAAPGTLDVALAVTRRWYVRPELSLYSRAEVGTSTLLFELVGVDRYSTGLFLGGVLLGVRIPLRPGLALTFDPAHLAEPIPQVTGLPFYYGQWRVEVGVELSL